MECKKEQNHKSGNCSCTLCEKRGYAVYALNIIFGAGSFSLVVSLPIPSERMIGLLSILHG